MSATVLGSKTVMSALAPLRNTPRSVRPSGGCRAGHLVHRLGERQQATVAGIVAEHTRECAVEARVRQVLRQRSARADGAAVRADRDPVAGDECGDIALVPDRDKPTRSPTIGSARLPGAPVPSITSPLRMMRSMAHLRSGRISLMLV
jgi:hypothetical protein